MAELPDPKNTFDINGIRDGLEKVLAKAECANFVDSLLKAAATKKNPLLTQYLNAASTKDGILAMFNAVLLQNSLTRTPPPGSAGYGNPDGHIANGDASIFAVDKGSDSALQLASDIKTILHELMHMAGQKNDYWDRTFAEIVRQDYGGLSTSIWPGDKRDTYHKAAMKDPNHISWGYYWNYGLSKKCF